MVADRAPSVMYFDSSGLAALVAAMKHARAAGGDIAVCMLESDVRALFEMTCRRAVVAVLVPGGGERAARVRLVSRHPRGGWGVALAAPRNEPRCTGEPVGASGSGAVNQFGETH